MIKSNLIFLLFNLMQLVIYVVFYVHNIMDDGGDVISTPEESNWRRFKDDSDGQDFSELSTAVKTLQSNAMPPLPYFPSRTWTINRHVLQYSSIVGRHYDNRTGLDSLVVEAIFFMNNRFSHWIPDELLRRTMMRITRCYVKLQDGRLHILTPKIVHSIYWSYSDIGTQFFHRVKCVLNAKHLKQPDNDPVVYVAVIDAEHRPNYTVTRHTDFDYMIAYQRATYFDTRQRPARQRVVHCVHMVRNVTENGLQDYMLDWLAIQRSIGYARIYLYVHNMDARFRRLLSSNRALPRGFVVFVRYQNRVSDICDRWHLAAHRAQPYSPFFEAVYKNCVRAVLRSFSLASFNYINSHEFVALNDCILRNKYQYEFLTIYDFDEVIFPRRHRVLSRRLMHEEARCKASTTRNILSNLRDYDINRFARTLMRNYTMSSSSSPPPPVGFFHFANVNMLTMSDHFTDQIMALNVSRLSSNHNRSTPALLRYNVSTYFAEIHVNASHADHTRSLQKLIEMTRCVQLQQRLATTVSHFRSKWFNLLALSRLSTKQRGKSIYVTRNIEIGEQHVAIICDRCVNVTLPVNQAFNSHFRDDLKDPYFGSFKANQTLDAFDISFDMEFFYFMVDLNSVQKQL